MKKKIFITTDEHGHYDELIEALNEAGYDENNPDHFRISLADWHDRGDQSLAIYEYYKRLCDEGKMVVLYSNHSEFFLDYLEGSNITPFNWMHNGTNATLDDFLHRTDAFQSWCMIDKGCSMDWGNFAKWIEEARNEINEEYPELISWITSRPYYYETKNYIFTHGMINGTCPNWKFPPERWQEWIWAKPKDFFNPIINTNKTVVVGHINTGLLRKLNNEDENDNSIYTRKDGRVIGLDACTILTKKINVLVIEDELL